MRLNRSIRCKPRDPLQSNPLGLAVFGRLDGRDEGRLSWTSVSRLATRTMTTKKHVVHLHAPFETDIGAPKGSGP